MEQAEELQRRAREIIGPDFALQGKLDPAMSLAPRQLRAQRVREILAHASPAKGYMFNLGLEAQGSGPLENVDGVIDTVRRFLG